MNTPRQRRRFDKEQWESEYWSKSEVGIGNFGLALDAPVAGAEFALLVTEFTHLEYEMEKYFARLLGVDVFTAAQVMRSIISAKTRIDMMRAVLERARHSASFPPEFDEVIEEFESINKSRNRFVHARWFTNIDSGAIYIIGPNEDPMAIGMPAMKEFDISEMTAVRDRIIELWRKISKMAFTDY